MIGLPRQRFWMTRLLGEALRAAVLVDLHHAELGRGVEFDRQRGHAYVRPAFQVLRDHLAKVHAIDVVRAKHGDVAWPSPTHEVQVLVDGVGRATIPVIAGLHLGGHGGDEAVPQRSRGQLPAALEVLDEGLRLELGQHVDGADAGVHEVREDEVDDPVLAAEGGRRFGPVAG